MLKDQETIKRSIFDIEIENYISNINGLENNKRITLPLILISAQKALEDAKSFIDPRIKKKNDFNKLPIDDYKKIVDLIKKRNLSIDGLNALLQSFIVSLISQYDAFLGRLIRIIIINKPQIIDDSEKVVTISEINSYSSIEALKNSYIEKKVENILRQNHSDQIKWLETKLNHSLINKIKNWKDFIEITERRNLFVHCRGVVSAQYIKICEENNIILENTKVGDFLSADKEYLEKCYQCVFLVGIELAHQLWRIIYPNEMKSADKNLNDIAYDLMSNNDFLISINLLNFADQEIKKFSNEEIELMMTINRAISNKLKGNEEECTQIITKVDWSAKSNEFKLASAILLNNYDEMESIMLKLGKNSSITEEEYIEWPLFKVVGQNPRFKKTFNNIFGKTFKIKSKTQDKLLTDIKKLIKTNLSDKIV